MAAHQNVATALVIGAVLGGLGAEGLHAQVKPIAYVIAEIEVNNQDAYAKEYLPPSSKALLDGGAKYLARGSRTLALKGEPPKRIVLLAFESLEQAQAAYSSPAFVEAALIGEQHAKFRIFAVEGIPQ